MVPDPVPRSDWWRSLLRPGVLATGWGLLAALAGLIVLPLEPNVLEEGLILHVAQRMVDGEHLYRDIVYYTGPAPFELLALLFRIFGESLVVARLSIVVLLALAAGCSYALVRRAGVGSLAHVAAACWAAAPILLFPLPITYYYTTIAFYLVPIALYLALRGRESSRHALLAGVLVGVVALCKQVLGVALAVTLLPALFATTVPALRWRQAGALLGGAALLAVFTLGLYAIRGDLGVLVYSLVQLPFELESTFHAPYMNLWPIGEMTEESRGNAPLYLPSLIFIRAGIIVVPSAAMVALTQLVYALPFIALLVTALRRFRGPLRPEAWLNLAGLLTLMANLYPRGDWGHVIHVVPIALVQLTLVARRTPGPDEPDREPFGYRIATALVCLALYTGSVALATWLNTMSRPQSMGPRVPLRPVSLSTRGPSMGRIVTYLRSHVYPEEKIFVARQEPLIYFATDTRNPTPYTGVVMGIRERQQREVIEGLKEVRYVVMSDIDQPLYAYYSDELPAVQKYFERHFSVATDFPVDMYTWIHVAQRGSDRGPAVVDFVDRRGEGLMWVRDASGRMHEIKDKVPKLPGRQMRRPFAVTLGEGGGGVDFRLTIPPGGVFQADVGLLSIVSKEERHEHPRAGRHALSISRDGVNFEHLLTRRVSDLHPRSAVRWKPFVVDLSEYAGQEVVLRLQIIAEAPLYAGDIGWWGSPRLTVKRPPAEKTGTP
jgi:hypothetical protein